MAKRQNKKRGEILDTAGQNVKRVFINLHPLAEDPGSIFKMCLSDRSDGKTTEMKVIGLESFLETGKTAVFCRRFFTELTQDFFDTFHENILASPRGKELLKGKKYFCKGSKKKGFGFYITQGKSNNEKKAFSILPITMAQKYKSSFDWATHKNIYFDEYIPLDNRYSPNEVAAILELYKTIDRNHFDNYVMICGNKITRFNPVFEYFNITEWKYGFNCYQNGRFCFYMHRNKGNAVLNEISPFAELTQGTRYESYNAGEFLMNYDSLVKPKHSQLMLMNISHNGSVYGVFQSGDDIVIDRATINHDVQCVCTSSAPPAHGAIWLKDELAKGCLYILQRNKFTNHLFFADELILHELDKFYKEIR